MKAFSYEIKWIEPQPVEVPADLREAVGGHPLVAETLYRRGIRTPREALAFLDKSRYTPAPASDLPDLSRAADRLELAIQNGERIGVWGDFDVDGQTSTTLLVSALRRLGAAVQFHIPVRATESHGINLPGLQAFLDSGVQLLLTCDTGITAHEAVDYAKNRGVDTIITDHHTLGETLPAACAVVNPQRLPPGHPLRTLSGVGAAYKLIEDLFTRRGWQAELEEFIDLVALGLVADVAELTGDARYLVQLGLERMRAHPRMAIQALLQNAEVNPANLTEENIGFALAPRLNALGRLDDANPIVDFFTSNDLEFVRTTATRLEGLNARRKLLCDQVFRAAQDQIARDPTLLNDPVLVLAHPQWPGGVNGIVASRLVDLYHRPAILLTTPPGEAARGSARSVEGVHITQAIAAQNDLLLSFGGHPMAAGLSLPAEKIPEFRRRLAHTIHEMLDGKPPVMEIRIDAEISLADLSMEWVADVDRLAPFGAGNPALIYALRNLTLRSATLLGRSGEHLRLIVEDETGRQQEVVWWSGAGAPLPEGRFDLACNIHAHNYRGQTGLQLVWVNARPHPEPIAVETPAPQVEVLDFRAEMDPAPALLRLSAVQPVQIWAEGANHPDQSYCTRNSVSRGNCLAIWTPPPGPLELHEVLNIVRPRCVALFAVPPGADQPNEFLARLMGLVRHALRADQGVIHLPELAAATAQRDITVRKGVDWLIARGNVTALEDNGSDLVLINGGSADLASIPLLEEQIRALLQESAAYRSHYRRANAKDLIANALR